MAVRFRSHLRLRECLLALLSALSVLLLTAPAAGAHRPLPRPPRPGPPPVHVQPSYLALGDSLAFGYSQAKFNSHFPEESPADFETGYVNDFGDVLKLFSPGLQIVNDGCPGETTESFINGPCAYQLGFPCTILTAAGRAPRSSPTRSPTSARTGGASPDHDRHRR